MRIVIAGAGEVGTHLAKMLSDEEQDIIVIDTNTEKLANLENYNLMTYPGNAVSFDVLKAVKVGQADLFIGVMPYEARNLLACKMAKDLGVKKTVARIENAEFQSLANLPFCQSLGISDLIYPEYLAAKEMSMALKNTWARNWFELFNGELIVVGVKVRENAQIVGHQLSDVSIVSTSLHVCAIKRNNELIIPRGDDRLLANDIAYIATTREHIDEVARVCGKKKIEVDHVMIMGGNDIALQLARRIGEDVHVKIIENDPVRSQELANLLPDCQIVNGDVRDTDLLEEEGISDYDVFVALTDNSAYNIVACMMAKAHGVPKTIAEVEDIQYINEAESLNIGTIVNKKLLASSRIFQIMLDSDDTNAKCLALSDAEVAEVLVKPDSKVTRKPVKDLNIPREITIAGLVRDGAGHLVTGATQLMAGDHVVVFCKSGSIHTVEKLFNK